MKTENQIRYAYSPERIKHAKALNDEALHDEMSAGVKYKNAL